MSHPSQDAIVDQAESEAIDHVLNILGIEPDHPAFDKLVDIKAEKIFKELSERPGPHG